MVKNLHILLVLIGLGAIFYALTSDFESSDALSPVAERYATQGPDEVGAANLVTAVVVTYRGLDTLGEVTILFLSAAIVAFFLKVTNGNGGKRNFRPVSEILQTAAKVLTPAIFLLGIYVFINGHLTPGGGFQGGAIVASGLVLMLLARPDMKISHTVIHVVESISGFAFVFIGILGIFYAGGFLDNSLISLGTFGTLLSAGAIPMIYIFVGLKVGAELSNIVGHLQESQNEA
ncbi:hydrogen gas-evolving membrane-bound hydrogenase subunit E [Salinivirga cyanobacteriivorans]